MKKLVFKAITILSIYSQLIISELISTMSSPFVMFSHNLDFLVLASGDATEGLGDLPPSHFSPRSIF